LDTDTLTLLAAHPKVTPQLPTASISDVVVTVWTVEEELSGWYKSGSPGQEADDLAQAIFD